MGRTATEVREATRIRWNVTASEADIIRKIGLRAHEKFGADVIETQMDLTATHCNGNPLRLQELLDADDLNFTHDVCGIYRHLDRNNGKLKDMFSPRFSRREQ
ncbi:hypothetical protein [Tardiphaga sp.]|jgi:hypothetical protein|uniref:DUF6874 family protein n=1 Tax=Tardiphaga sp. TaxID=1926292 RepID=UPI0037D99F07